MASGYSTCGGRHLAKRSALARVHARLELNREILVIDDEHIDADRLMATLRVVFGYEAEITHAASLSDAIAHLVNAKPALVFLDDILKPSTDASQAIPLLREAGYDGPIIVVSGQVTHARATSLIAAGASDVIHKDDVDSVRVAEAVLGLRASGPERPSTAQPGR